MTEKRFKVYKVIGSFGEWSVEDTVDDKVVFGSIMHKYEADRLCDKLNELNDENEELKHNNKMLSMKMSEVYTKYCLLKEFSEDTNPNDAVKRVLSELMQITKEYR